MSITMTTPAAADLPAVVAELATWQVDAAPVQLHPGDIGWHWRNGADEVARVLRTWHDGGRLLAVGFLDGRQLMRLGIAPRATEDIRLARAVEQDVADPGRGLLDAGEASVEVPLGTAVADALLVAGWTAGVPWAPLRRDLSEPVEEPGVRIRLVGPEQAGDWVDVQRSAFGSTRLTVEKWLAMSDAPNVADSRCLLAYDDAGAPVAGAAVWSAGEGRPGLIEPLGAHSEHRGRGHGRAITLACAATLRDMGASSVLVKTEGHNAAGIAAYRSAGLVPDPPAPDLTRA
ncbi:MAG: GNAT family N-acetyltransferase [Actinomycetaceae bacterium]